MRFPSRLALVTLLAACGEATRPPTPARIDLSLSSVQLDALGARDTVRATVRDEGGQELPDVTVTWTASPGLSVTPLTARNTAEITAVAIGSGTITARAGEAAGTLPVTVAPVAATMTAVNPIVYGTVGTLVASAIEVVAHDRLGAPAEGVRVVFSTAGGTVTPASMTTGPDGLARATWTLGPVAGEQLVTAAAGGVSATFRAVASPGPAATFKKHAGDAQTGWTGYPLQHRPAVRVQDAHGNAVSGVTVSFVPSDGTVSSAQVTTDGAGVAAVTWSLGTTAGPTTLTAAAAGLGPDIVFTATGEVGEPLATIQIVSGYDQLGIEGQPLAEPAVVRVVDSTGTPQADRDVVFELVSGSGTLSRTTATTGADGLASVDWTMGPVSGPNAFRIRISDGPATNNGIEMAATACTGGSGAYVINVCFGTPVTAAQRAVFLEAAAKWSAIITADIPDLRVQLTAPACEIPPLNTTLDDLMIVARIEPIDGPGGVLGSAGWCYRRADGLPILGRMRFDAADVQALEADGRFREVVLHEMGHVIGLGTMWSASGHLQNPSTPDLPPLDTHFSGTNAIAGFDQIGGLQYTAGAKVPVENTGGLGSINSHWRESELRNELMTPRLNSGTNPLTVLTVLSLRDIGYEVNPLSADPYLSADVFADRRGLPALLLQDDVYTGPQYSLDRSGRVRRIR